MSTQEFEMAVFLEALSGLNPKSLTVPQMERLLSALEGKEAAYRREIALREEAMKNRLALTGMNWSAA